ncbi:peroxiredoxin-like family protein [Aestuariirhabdus litorea]|uniref:thioredoxin-dependent peroxiredoxin n=1 Tax=Aestuariirhabdus litorea TaxID=2528527 RepID=A0A3P3VL18_9GAMM|nr:peroxiredoxin-like family protein [Aestuariirhabdus litorea]RRJ82469.1 AhpC/TSA family protein [Aestuariirhabdus litorea]RWW92630.1 redoxin domain-containing protein [Endozoicomonadaceae bacterium GTF-13]
MTTLTDQIAAYDVQKQQKVPAELLQQMEEATRALVATGIEQQALNRGDSLPDITLPNARGEQVRLYDLLQQGPLVINFYRGGWCPYCNLELAALQSALPEILARGAQLVAISPQTPDQSLSTAEKNALAFEVLCDVGNRAAEQFGLVFELPDSIRAIYDKFGIDVVAHNGDSSFKLPVPASYVVNRDGVISYAFVNADYTRRVEPSELVNAL